MIDYTKRLAEGQKVGRENHPGQIFEVIEDVGGMYVLCRRVGLGFSGRDEEWIHRAYIVAAPEYQDG